MFGLITLPTFWLTCMLCSCSPSFAQESKPSAQNVWYGELLGNCIGLSINYDRYVFDNFTGRVGLGTYINGSYRPPGDSLDRSVFVPLFTGMINYLIGAGDTKIEIGAGILAHLSSYTCDNFFEKYSCSRIKGTFTLGYRNQPTNGGFTFRAGITPVIDLQTSEFFGWFGVSFGNSF